MRAFSHVAFNGRDTTVKIKCEAGRIRVEIEDASGRVVVEAPDKYLTLEGLKRDE